MKSFKFFGVIFLIVSFIFSPLSFSNILVQSQAADFEEIIGYQEWTQDKVISGFINVNDGATLVIKNGVTLTFDNGSINVDGRMITSGTVKNPVIFKKSASAGNYAITVGGELIMRNADVSGAGHDIHMVRKNSILNTAKAFFVGGISVSAGGSVDIQGSNFHNNVSAISLDGGGARVYRTKFNNNENDVAGGSYGDFQYNWWGSSDGPAKTCYDYPTFKCYYDKIDSNGVNVSNWLTEENFKDPVIIVPGILGSWEKDGQLQIDPIFHTYDNLYAEFANNGYTPEKDLFVFPYEWRDSNIENAKLLRDKINEIKTSQNWPKVDVVAHSMGGLLAREYIESDYYSNDVDQLITLATPNLGAPESYMKWDGDGWFFSPVDVYMKHIVKQEAKENGFSDSFDYIHNRPMASIQELLPVYSYLYEADNGNKLKEYPNNYPRNEFLEILNSKVDKLALVEYDKIIGNTGRKDTVSGVNVVNADMGKYWTHGYPLGFEVLIGDRGMIYSSGDVTVPIDSARSVDIKSDHSIELASDHQSIVTDAQKDVLELLTGIRPTTEVRRSLIKNILITQVFSPIDIQIVAPDGKRVGKDFVTGEILNEIEGAFYSGYETESEFLTIPNPLDGEYKILTQGTGDGAYKIETTKISESENASQEALESIATIEGIAEEGAFEEKKITVTGDRVSADEVIDREADINSIIESVNLNVSDEKTKKFLLVKLSEISHIFEMLAKMESKTPPYDNQIKLLNKKIDELIGFIQNKKTLNIPDQVRADLIGDLVFIKR